MKARPTLSKKIFFLAFLNLLLLALVLVIFMTLEFRFQVDSLLMGPAEGRISAAKDLLSIELRDTPPDSRNDILDRYSAAYGVRFILADNDARQLGGVPVSIPDEVRERIMHPGRPGPPPWPPAKGPDFNGDRSPPPRAHRPLPPNPPLFLVTARQPTSYWVGLRMPIPSSAREEPIPGVLLLTSPTLLGNPFFFNVKPWLALILAVIGISVACWLPFVQGLTSSIRGMSAATAQLAEGRFDVQLTERRGDELGQLSGSINRMTAQLRGFIDGQKRFLGDTAHELCAPIARLQFALGILEQHAAPSQHRHVADLQEEVQHMSGLVNELLSFSKAAMQGAELKLTRIDVAEIVKRVLAREKPGEADLKVDVPAGLAVLADADGLFRSLSNVVRNALRYAGSAGPITVLGRLQGNQVLITVADNGPGLPEEALEEIFKPFYRPERARTREGGGAGLGFAIVKTCIEACRGTVTARNRKPAGLEIEIRLPAAPVVT